MMDAKKLGQFIAQLRKEQNMTQADLARKLQVTDKAVSKWERGIGLPDINSIEPLAEALGVTVLEIMRSEKIPVEDVTPESASAMIADAFDLAKAQRKQERKSLITIAVGVFIAIALLFLADTMGWMGFAFVLLPFLCFAISLCLIIYGIIRHRNQNSCAQTFIWAAITGAYPLLLLTMLFLAGVLGIGPVPT